MKSIFKTRLRASGLSNLVIGMFLALILMSATSALGWPAKSAVAAAVDSSAATAGVEVAVPNAILIDVDSGEVLAEKGSEERAYIASTTKIMTALLVLEAKEGELAEVVTVTQKAADVGGAGLDLEAGERIVLEDLLYGLLLRSANDAAVVLAEAVAGSEAKFVQKMNARAKKIGAGDTRFFNPHGLERNYSTARDLALISLEALQGGTFRRMVATKSRTIPWPGNPYPRVAKNHNKLSQLYEYAEGVKTGYTREAGNCLVALASKKGRRLVTVVLGGNTAASVYSDTIALMEYGFNDFEVRQVVKQGQRYESIGVPFWTARQLPLLAKQDEALLVKKGAQIEPQVIVDERIRLPISRGQAVGEVKVVNGRGTVANVPLVAAERVPAPSIWERIKVFLTSLLG